MHLKGTDLDQYRAAWLGLFGRVEPKVLEAKIRAFRKRQTWGSTQTNPFALSAVSVATYLVFKRGWPYGSGRGG